MRKSASAKYEKGLMNNGLSDKNATEESFGTAIIKLSALTAK